MTDASAYPFPISNNRVKFFLFMLKFRGFIAKYHRRISVLEPNGDSLARWTQPESDHHKSCEFRRGTIHECH
jgi:hypothetical protein